MTTLTGRKLLDRYEVKTYIGRGGMADVYKVWDAQRSTYLAMKVLHDHLAVDRVFMRRFQHEAQLLSSLRHPHIVPFYGIEQDGRSAYMFLDYIQGDTLKRKIFDTDGPLTLLQVHHVLRAVCNALQFAHNEGIVHCDIKPENIMVSDNGGVWLSDFGIARHVDAATATLVGAGAPAYMPPEQIRSADPTPQMDIYALGVTLYEMLSGGDRPFSGNNAQIDGNTIEKVYWEHLNLTPKPLNEINPDIPQTVNDVIMKCLAKNPSDRYGSAIDLWNAFVHSFPPDIVVDEQPRWKPRKESASIQPTQTIPKRRRAPVYLGLAFVVVLAFGFFAAFPLLNRGQEAAQSKILLATETQEPTLTTLPQEIAAALTEIANPTEPPMLTVVPSPTETLTAIVQQNQNPFLDFNDLSCKSGALLKNSFYNPMTFYYDDVKLELPRGEIESCLKNIPTGMHTFQWCNAFKVCNYPCEHDVVLGEKHSDVGIAKCKTMRKTTKNPYNAWIDDQSR